MTDYSKHHHPEALDPANCIEFEVSASRYALFTDPITKVSGEKMSYPVPTYEALRGVLSSVYWKPTFTWVIDAVRIMNPIKFESRGQKLLRYVGGGNDLAFFTYLTGEPRYQVKAHLEFNLNHPEFENDRNLLKHIDIAKKSLKRGGRFDIFLGTRECQGYVTPCEFGSGEGAYDKSGDVPYGAMFHSHTYPDQAYSADTENCLTANFFYPLMRNGIIEFPLPQECPVHKFVRPMKAKVFPDKKGGAK